MTDKHGDKSKQPPECKINDAPPRCPNIKSRESWDTETFDCRVCGEHYTLYDEDMK
jgi:hypothetical protein